MSKYASKMQSGDKDTTFEPLNLERLNNYRKIRQILTEVHFDGYPGDHPDG